MAHVTSIGIVQLRARELYECTLRLSENRYLGAQNRYHTIL